MHTHLLLLLLHKLTKYPSLIIVSGINVSIFLFFPVPEINNTFFDFLYFLVGKFESDDVSFDEDITGVSTFIVDKVCILDADV